MESTLHEGQFLLSNSKSTLESKCKKFTVIMQHDGNLVVYSGKQFTPQNAIWASHTDNKGVAPFKLSMQSDGNLVIYDARNTATWSSKTNGVGAGGNYVCKLRSNGQIVILDKFKQYTFISNPTTKHHLLPTALKTNNNYQAQPTTPQPHIGYIPPYGVPHQQTTTPSPYGVPYQQTYSTTYSTIPQSHFTNVPGYPNQRYY